MRSFMTYGGCRHNRRMEAQQTDVGTTGGWRHNRRKEAQQAEGGTTDTKVITNLHKAF